MGGEKKRTYHRKEGINKIPKLSLWKAREGGVGGTMGHVSRGLQVVSLEGFWVF